MTPEQAIQRLREQAEKNESTANRYVDDPGHGVTVIPSLTLLALLDVAEAARKYEVAVESFTAELEGYEELRTALARLAGERPGD